MGTHTSARRRSAEPEPSWHDDAWQGDHEESCAEARRLLARRKLSPFAWLGGFRRYSAPGWLRWTAAGLGAAALLVALCFGALWWRLGAGPINLDMATPWLAQAIEQNIGQGNTVEIGGTQIERTGRIRIAVRVRDVIVRDRDHAIVATAPKAEVRLSNVALLWGQLRAESVNLVDAELAIRITPDGNVTVSAGNNERPIATGVASTRDRPPAAGTSPPVSRLPDVSAAVPPRKDEPSALLAGLDWLDSLSLTGLDGQNLNEIGLKNGALVIDDQQRGSRWSFDNVSLSLRRPHSGGVALSLGQDGERPWSLRVAVGRPANGVRSIDIRAREVSTANMLLALRLKDLTYGADLPLSGEIKGEVGRDGVPTFLRGRVTSGPGTITDFDTPNYPLHLDSAEFNVEWDSARRVLLAPFKVVAGANRVTLLAHLAMPNDGGSAWELGFSGGTIVLPGEGGEQPLVFNKIAVRFQIDPRGQRVSLAEANINNGELGISASGAVDYASEPFLNLTFVATPMSSSALKRLWPILVAPEVREWVQERVERGTLQRLDVALRSPIRNLSRRGPPIPDDGMLINIAANGVTLRPVDDLPVLREGDLRARITGRTATVNVLGASMETQSGRRLGVNDIAFEVPDMAPKPSPARVRFKVDAPVPAVAEILASDRLAEFSGAMIDPVTSAGKVAAQVTLNLPIKRELTKQDTSYSISADLSQFAADKLVLNQKLEANALKVVANNQGYQVRGDVRINGQPATVDYRKPADGEADVKMQATLDDASRARLGVDLSPYVTGAVPVKLAGKLGSGDQETRLGIECDLTQVRVDNLLPGWSKPPGKPTKAAFSVIQKAQSTRLEEISIEGGGATIKGTLEVDQNGEVLNAAFPVFAPSEGDKATLKAERAPDGVLKVTMRGDVFDGRGFIKSAMSGREPDAKAKSKSFDFDLDLRLGAVAGYYGEALRAVDVKTSRRNGAFTALKLTGKLGRDTLLSGDLRGRNQGREVVYIETNDAGAFLRFTDTYAKVIGGQMSLAMEPPNADSRPKEGLINVRDFAVKGEAALERVASNQPGAQPSVTFSRLRAEFSRQNGVLAIHEGVVKGPMIGATIEGSIDYPANQVRMSGTFVPMYGLNNMFGQIPIVGLFLGGSNEGLIGVTYEVVGTPGAPVLRVNPISAMAPGVLRKIFEFGTGRQNNAPEFPSMPNN